jgi:hypothetical protein
MAFPKAVPAKPLSDGECAAGSSSTDTELLAEFYASVREVDDILASWIATAQTLGEYNAWNVLMHKVQHSLRKGELAVRRFDPDRLYDATMPAGGTLLYQSERVLSMADTARTAFMARHAATQAPVPNRRARRR